jgi:hypothetical protein
MALEPFPSKGPLSTRPPMVQVIDQSIRDEHSKSMPSREERKELLNSMSAQCSYAQCGKILARSEVKICSRCKQVSCQKRVGEFVSPGLMYFLGSLLLTDMSEGTLVRGIFYKSDTPAYSDFLGERDTRGSAAKALRSTSRLNWQNAPSRCQRSPNTFRCIPSLP